jgi:hypothetical protein
MAAHPSQTSRCATPAHYHTQHLKMRRTRDRKKETTMSTINPKDIETKVNRVLSAWEALAPAKSFGGMTLDQFKAQVAPAKAARQQMETLDSQMKQAMVERDMADDIALAKSQMIVNGVLGDPTEGPDSSLYAAMGYTRKSERKSGLTRKSHRAPAPTA